MMNFNDLVDVIMAHLTALEAKKASGPDGKRKGDEPRGRLFLSEHDIRKRLTPDSEHLKIPKDAILSPLASDWLILKGIKVIRE